MKIYKYHMNIYFIMYLTVLILDCTYYLFSKGLGRNLTFGKKKNPYSLERS
jgi:hypothetical protein